MAVANEPLIHEPVENQPARQSTSLLSVVWQRKSLVVLGVVTAMVLGTLFWFQRQPRYQTIGEILVVKKSADVTPGTNSLIAGNFQNDYMSSQPTILKSQVIASMTANSDPVRRRLEEVGFHSFPEASKPEQLIMPIRENLSVTRESQQGNNQMTGNNVILLQFRATDSEECQIILENLIESYKKYVDDKFQQQSEKLVKLITKMHTELNKAITDADAKLTAFRKAAPLASTRIFGNVSEVQKRAQDLSERVAKIRAGLSDRESILAILRDIYDKKGPAEAKCYVLRSGLQSLMNGDPETAKALMSLRLKEKELLSQFGQKHPQVMQIRAQIESLQEEVFSGDREKGTDPKTDQAKSWIGHIETDVDAQKKRLAAMDHELNDSLKEYKDVAAHIFEEARLEEERNRAFAEWQKIDGLVKDTDLKHDAGGFEVNVLTQPGIGIKISPIAYQVFSAAGLLGLLFGVGLAYLAEISDKSFRNPMEIRKRLGLPVIGHVPFLAADQKAQQLVAAGTSTLDPMLVTHYQSNSIGAEAYRGVRTALYFSTQGAGHQVIQVTSPNVSDGKSTLAANMAVSIAQSGKRTLLVDCDFRKPRVHKIFNVPAQVGIASVIGGQADLNSATQQSAIPNLSIMPCGPRPTNPAELLTSPKFKDILEELRTKYDFVIVDTPPILVVTDPAVVAPRVDGVVLCIRVTKNGRPYAERAREVLVSLGANILGIVVNGFGAQVGGNRYGYEHYQYGYGEGYAYTYGYTYGYADKEAASYYAGAGEDQPRPTAPAVKS